MIQFGHLINVNGVIALQLFTKRRKGAKSRGFGPSMSERKIEIIDVLIVLNDTQNTPFGIILHEDN